MIQTQPILSRDEWRAVAVALQDAAKPCAGPSGPGLFGRLYRTFTGNGGRQPLADARLEAIRRFVCASRRLRGVDERAASALQAQGFSRAQVEALRLLSA